VPEAVHEDSSDCHRENHGYLKMHSAYLLDGRLDPTGLASAETYSLVLKDCLRSRKKKDFIPYLRGEFETSGKLSVYSNIEDFCLHSTNWDPPMIAGNTWIEYLHQCLVWIAWSLVATDVIWISCRWVCWTLSWFMGSELILTVKLNTTILWDVPRVVWYNFLSTTWGYIA
jgi:hypothetical protein